MKMHKFKNDPNPSCVKVSKMLQNFSTCRWNNSWECAFYL